MRLALSVCSIAMRCCCCAQSRTSSSRGPSQRGVATSSPAVLEPSQATTMSGGLLRPARASSWVRTCSDPPTASGPTGTSGNATLSTLSVACFLQCSGRCSPIELLVVQGTGVGRLREIVFGRRTESFRYPRRMAPERGAASRNSQTFSAYLLLLFGDRVNRISGTPSCGRKRPVIKLVAAAMIGRELPQLRVRRGTPQCHPRCERTGIVIRMSAFVGMREALTRPAFDRCKSARKRAEIVRGGSPGTGRRIRLARKRTRSRPAMASARSDSWRRTRAYSSRLPRPAQQRNRRHAPVIRWWHAES